MQRGYLFPTLSFLLMSCASPGVFITEDSELTPKTPSQQSRVVSALYLTGGLSSGSTFDAASVLQGIRNDIASRSDVDADILVLGDVLPATGLPDSGAVGRDQAVKSLDFLHTLASIADDVILVPGELDWQNGQSSGLRSVLSLGEYVSGLGYDNLRVSPEAGFPGPEPFEISDNTILLVVDSQWWLHRYQKPFGDTGQYDLTEAGDFLLELEELLRKNRSKTVILAMHHPIESVGLRAGHFPLKYHMVPFPGIGSFSVLYRKLFGAPQDLAHHRYKEFRREIQRLTRQHENLIIASGHDTGIQYNRSGSRLAPVHHINSSTDVVGHTTPNNQTVFTSTRPGFAVIETREDGSVSLKTIHVDLNNGFATELFRHDGEAVTVAIEPSDTRDFPDSVITAINPKYDIVHGPISRLVLGPHYRKAWAAPFPIAVLDMAAEAGGLSPIKIGGRGQSVTLRVEDREGNQYVLRTVDKQAGRAWRSELRNTIANSVTQDQISLLHPMAAFIVADLAETAGVMHANPKLFYVPDDPLLGPFRETMANRIVLFEERADENVRHINSFGNAENAVGYKTMFRKLDDDNDNRVDQQAFARARLFDILISDWDRHYDQWRWAEFKNDGKGSTYRPIPRDRDVAFMTMDGLVASVAQLTALRNWQDFENDFGYLRGLTRNGVGQDRRLTSELSVGEWIGIAADIQDRLSDEAIEKAFGVLPDTIAALNGDDLASILKYRRDRLHEIADKFARLLAKDVDVVGSNKHEDFYVERLSNDSMRVTVFKTKKDGERISTLYQRTFARSETKEVFLFGQGGSDRFTIVGDVSKSIRVTAVGGAGFDSFTDSSTVQGVRRMSTFFDTMNSDYLAGTESKVRLSSDPAVNVYNPRAYKFNGLAPLAFFGKNKDDGIFIGGGFTRTIHGFRKSPFKSSHAFVANVATRTGAFNVKYNAVFNSIFEHAAIRYNLGIFTPNNIRNFYGLGNESQNDSLDASFYQARLSKVESSAMMSYRINDRAHFAIGPVLDFTEIRRDSLRFVSQTQAGLNPNTFEDQLFTGVRTSFSIDAVDNPKNPKNGFSWNSEVGAFFGIRNSSASYATASTDLRVFFPISYYPQITLASRVGGRHVQGKFPFYSASTLGGASNLRGYRGTRFAGRSSAFYNVEVRASLFRFSTFLSYGTLGVFGFADGGRVWTDGESSELWHEGFGAGIWGYLFDSITVTTSYARSTEDNAFGFGAGFQF